MGQPKVSILISFYNLAPYVDETLESVLHQKTDFPIEVLCADDGSAENCACGSRSTRMLYASS